MTAEDYDKLKVEVLNAAAPHIIALHKMGKTKRALTIMEGTGSKYLAERFDGDFAGRYLNSDNSNQQLWLKMFGVVEPSVTKATVLHQAMLFFNNHSLDHCFGSNWLRSTKISAFGNAENWCKLWVKLCERDKQYVINFF